MARLNREIIIAGGGLAGLSLGIGLRLRGIPVTVHEAGSYPRHRVCGEFISGVDQSTLEELGISDLFDQALHHRSIAWWSGDELLSREVLPEPALGISRFRLDQMLKDRLESLGGEVREKSRLPYGEIREGQVWAAGRVRVKSDWIGLKAHFIGLPMEADLEMHLGRNGYAGLAGIEDAQVNVCGLFRKDATVKGSGAELLLAYLRAGGQEALAARLEAAQTMPDSFTGVAGFSLGHQPHTPGVLAIGDAESMIPPFTGNGMSMAFQAAETSLLPIERWSRGLDAWSTTMSQVDALLKKRFRRRLATAGILHPFLTHSFGRSALAAMARTGSLPFRPLLALVR